MNIKKVIDKRGLGFLVHFTDLRNLESILNYGLYSRIDIENNFNDVFINDEDRFEDLNGGICLSISFPNSRMFYSCRQKNTSSDWCVLVLDINILLDKNCLFFDTNAAYKKFRDYDLDSLSTGIALENLFESEVETKSGMIARESMSYLLISDPTDVQAEVICMERIEPNYILGCIFNSNKLKKHYETKLTSYKFVSHYRKWGVFDDRARARNENYVGWE